MTTRVTLPHFPSSLPAEFLNVLYQEGPLALWFAGVVLVLLVIIVAIRYMWIRYHRHRVSASPKDGGGANVSNQDKAGRVLAVHR